MIVSVLVPIMLIGAIIAIAVIAFGRSNSRGRGSRYGGAGGAAWWAGDSGSGSAGGGFDGGGFDGGSGGSGCGGGGGG